MTELIAILMSLIAGEIRNIPPARDRRARDTRDSYVIVALDREEIFRTATAEKTLSPFFGEEFGFQVPREFRQLTFYVMVNDCLPLCRDLKLGRVAIDKEALVKGEAAEDKWYPVLPIDLDSEVQVHKLSVSVPSLQPLPSPPHLYPLRERCIFLSAIERS
jgi:Ras GTPase-activating protein 3